MLIADLIISAILRTDTIDVAYRFVPGLFYSKSASNILKGESLWAGDRHKGFTFGILDIKVIEFNST